MYGLDPWTTRLDGDNAMCITRLQIHRHWWKRDPGCKYIVSQRQWQRVARFGGLAPEAECGVSPKVFETGEKGGVPECFAGALVKMSWPCLLRYRS